MPNKYKGFQYRARKQAERDECTTIIREGTLKMLQYNVDTARDQHELSTATKNQQEYINKHNILI